MLRVPDIIHDKARVIEGLKKRDLSNAETLIDEVVKEDEERKRIQKELDDTLQRSNNLSKQIGGLMKEGKKEEAERVKSETGQLKSKSKSLQEQLREIENVLTKKLYDIPNVPHDSVPAGSDEENNEVIHEKGIIPLLQESALPHWELIEKYDIIDFDLGIKVTGAGFPIYKGKGAKLQRALINFFLHEAEQAGYFEVQPPIIVNSDSGVGTGNLPDKEGQMYGIVDSEFYLIPTAEVPITNLYRDVILRNEDLPVKNVGYTPCFRREAGSWGSHVRGLNRLHQFDKVEIVQVRKPAESYQALEEMTDYVEGLIKKLELPFRRLRLCGGDLGFASALTYDMEVYAAGQQKWLEVSSISNFESFQTNRLKLRYKNEDRQTALLHTLNGSALALPRVVAALLENNQTGAGIKIPEVLQPYTGFSLID